MVHSCDSSSLLFSHEVIVCSQKPFLIIKSYYNCSMILPLSLILSIVLSKPCISSVLGIGLSYSWIETLIYTIWRASLSRKPIMWIKEYQTKWYIWMKIRTKILSTSQCIPHHVQHASDFGYIPLANTPLSISADANVPLIVMTLGTSQWIMSWSKLDVD